MAYFSSGSEGADYEHRVCSRCVHNKRDGESCPVLSLHFLYNYDQCKSPIVAEMLSALIPRSDDGLTNLKCRMFTQLIVGNGGI